MSDAGVAYFSPVSGKTSEALDLTMQRLWLTGEVLPFGARLVAAHTFQVNASKPVEAIYCFPLPRDAALRRFRIEGEHFTAHSELKDTKAAVQQYEAAIDQGSLAALVRQYGDGLMNLSLGNLRPNEIVTVYLELLAGVESHDDGYRFRFPFTLAPLYHPHMKAVEIAPGEIEQELPRDLFGDVILPRVRNDAKGLHEFGFALNVPRDVEEVGSPSHKLRVRQGQALLAGSSDLPNRDLVLDIQTGTPRVRIFTGCDHFAAVIPSTAFGAAEIGPRKVVLLIDRSGSMGGEPIRQAHRAVEACLGALTAEDQFGIVAFDDLVEQFRPKLVPANKQNRDDVSVFLQNTPARGGTELAQGVEAAARLLNGAGDIMILTDGQVAGTEEILARARATGLRLHCLGIGSASQDRFLALLARETGGVGRFVTPEERVDLAAVSLFASVGRAVAENLQTDRPVQPAPPTSVFAKTPVVLYGAGLDPVTLTWNNGSLALPIAEGEPQGEVVRLLQGARRITDLESRYPENRDLLNAADRLMDDRITRQLRTLSEQYGLVSRTMSLVATVTRKGDLPGELPEIRVVAVGTPPGEAIQQVFVGARRPSKQQKLGRAMASAPSPLMANALPGLDECILMAPPMPAPQSPAQSKAPGGSIIDHLMALAAQLEPDGGMPGNTLSERVRATAVALLAFRAGSQSGTGNTFAPHEQRLMQYLETLDLTPLPANQQKAIDLLLKRLKTNWLPTGDWTHDPNWPELIKALQTL